MSSTCCPSKMYGKSIGCHGVFATWRPMSRKMESSIWIGCITKGTTSTSCSSSSHAQVGIRPAISENLVKPDDFAIRKRELIGYLKRGRLLPDVFGDPRIGCKRCRMFLGRLRDEQVIVRLNRRRIENRNAVQLDRQFE